MFLNKSAKSGTSFTKKVSDLEPCIKYVPKLEFFTLKNVNFDTFHNFPKTLPQAFFYAIVLDVRTEKQESEERNIDSKNYTQAANERTGWAAGSPRNRRPLPERKKPYCMGRNDPAGKTGQPGRTGTVHRLCNTLCRRVLQQPLFCQPAGER